MIFDFMTLTAAGGAVALVCALLLIFAWTQYDSGRAALRLGAAHVAGAAAIILLALGSQNTLMTFLAQPLFVLAAFLALSSVLAFQGRGRLLTLLICAAAACMAMWMLRVAGSGPGPVRILQLAVIAPLFFVAAGVLWQGRTERLGARYPLAAVFLLHAAMNSVGLIEAVLREALPTGVPSFSSWYGLIHVESMIYFIGSALFMVALLKERSEARHKMASLTDPLTGLPNRRAFLYSGERMLERCRRAGTASTVIAIDLDRFKAVNDTYGHALGDRVLQVFAAVAQEQLRPFDIIGRLGGEEFAALLPRTHAREGVDVAERIRTAFAERARTVDGHDVGATLSVGVAVVFGSETTIPEVLERADAALYRAKLNGRDRVEVSADRPPIGLVRATG